MKHLFFFLLSVSLAPLTYAGTLKCASKADQHLYYSSGQIRIVTQVASPELLTSLSLSTTGSDSLGLRAVSKTIGAVQGKYVRFQIGADAWCSYRLALPKDFSTQKTVVAYLDASCEESSKYSISLNCAIR